MSLLYCCSAFLASSRIGLDKDVVLNVRTRSTSGNPDCGDSESGIGGVMTRQLKQTDVSVMILQIQNTYKGNSGVVSLHVHILKDISV